MTSVDIWLYREATWNQIDLTGYSVEALLREQMPEPVKLETRAWAARGTV